MLKANSLNNAVDESAVKIDVEPSVKYLGDYQRKTIQFVGLTYSVPVPVTKGGEGEGVKYILKNISGILRPGRLTVILGASGAGKTSLLNVLSGQARQGTLSGEILVNGAKITGSALKKMSGFVHQDDISLDTQTVQEAVNFSSILRNPLSLSEKKEKAHQVISLMHLQKAANTYIGSALIKGVSGGEKKRTCIGIELVTNPTILFLDEPTSGLDTYNAFSVVKSLKHLARTGRTIIATLHQPSSEIFHLIDDLILMAEGCIIYHGPAETSVDYFAQIGFPCPKYSNPADFFFMSVFNSPSATVVPNDDSDDADPGLDLEATSAKVVEEKPLTRSMTKEQRDKLEELGAHWNASPQQAELLAEIQSVKCPDGGADCDGRDLEERKTYRAPFHLQFKLLLARAGKNALRNKMVLLVKIFQTIPIAVVMDLIYWQIPNRENNAQIQDRAGFLFFLVTNQIFSNSFSGLNLFAAERLVFLREHSARMYGLPAYFLTKALVDIPILLFVPLLMAVLTYFAVGLQASAEKFFIHSANLILLAGCGHALGLWAAATFSNVNIALAVLPLIILPLMVFSGLFVNIAAIPAWIRWIQWLSPMKYGFVSLMKNEFDGLILPCSSPSGGPPGGAACSIRGEQVIQNFGLDGQGSILTNGIILLGFWVGLWLLAYLGFWNVVRKSKGNFVMTKN